MIQPGGMSECLPGRRKYSGMVQEDALYISRRAPAQGTNIISYHCVLYALTLCVVPVQPLGLVFFVFFSSACTAVDPWSDHLAARVYLQHLTPDG